MSADQASVVSHPDSINEFAIVSESGFKRTEGPFSVEKEGTLWTVRIPTDPQDPAYPGDISYRVLGGQDEGDGAALVADGEIVGGGIVKVVDEPEGEGELHVVVDQYARGVDA